MSTDPIPRTDNYSHPKPEATEYAEIIQNPDIFFQKLQSFHVFCGNKLRIPKLGGNRLDLHQLFLEVTSRGGLEKVIRDRGWKEVTGALNLPSSITNASFVLRKYYLSLLHQFEQVYYLRKDEPSVLVADQARRIFNGSALPHAVDDGALCDQLLVSHNLDNGSLVTGTIDGKFDDGYLVTVNLGSENLKGVLYHVSVETSVPRNLSTSGVHPVVGRSRRKRQSAFDDPTHPKRNRSGYTFFYAEQYPRLKSLYRGQQRAIRSKAISTKIGQLWSNMTEAEKQVYQEKGRRDKERYQAEMLGYKPLQAQHQ